MKLTNMVACAAAMALVTGQAMASDIQQGATVSGANVLVVRDGKVVSLDQGGAVQFGDRVVSRGDNAQIAFAEGCKLDVPAASSFTVGTEGCNAQVNSLAVSRSGFGMQEANSLGGGGAIILGLAIIAAGLGAYFAVDGGSKPTSP